MGTKIATGIFYTLKLSNKILIVFTLLCCSCLVNAQGTIPNTATDDYKALLSTISKTKTFTSNAASFDYPTELKTRKNPITFKKSNIQGINHISFSSSSTHQATIFERDLRSYLAQHNATINIDCQGLKGDCGFYTPREFIRTSNRRALFEQHSPTFNLNRHAYRILSAIIQSDKKIVVTAFFITDTTKEGQQVVLDWTSAEEINPDTPANYTIELPTIVENLMPMHVFFDVNSAQLNPSQLKAMRVFAQKIQSHPKIPFLISGHTDSSGTQDYNILLANKRAQSVAAALIHKFKVPQDQLTLQPATSAKINTASQRAHDRRVDITMGKP